MSQVQFIKRKYIVPVLHEGFYQVANINRTVVYFFFFFFIDNLFTVQ